MLRGRRFLMPAGLLLVAGLVAGGIVLAFGGSSQAAPTTEEYFARIAAICRAYGPRLDRIAPPGDIATPGEVAEPLKLALPLVVAELGEVRALRPPSELALRVKRWLVLRDRAVAMMRKTLREALLPDIRTMGPDWLRFMDLQKAAGEAGSTVGFPKDCDRG